MGVGGVRKGWDDLQFVGSGENSGGKGALRAVLADRLRRELKRN